MLIIRGHAWSWVHIGCGHALCVGVHRAWVHMGCGHIWVVGGVVVGCGHLSCMGDRLSCLWALIIHGGGSLLSMGGALLSAGWLSVGGGEGGHCGPQALSVGAGYRLWVLGVSCARWVPLWVLGISWDERGGMGIATKK